MSYERQRASAVRLIKKYGAAGTLTRKLNTPNVQEPWKVVQTIVEVPVYFTSFPDDGTVFIDHNLQGNLRVLTVVGVSGSIEISVGDTITTASGEIVQIREAKALNPDETEVILWAALVL